MAQTTRNARLADLSSSNPVRWRLRADREHDPGGRRVLAAREGSTLLRIGNWLALDM
jgi:hypothetical protein